jgi:hypothetical protein
MAADGYSHRTHPLTLAGLMGSPAERAGLVDVVEHGDSAAHSPHISGHRFCAIKQMVGLNCHCLPSSA